MYLDLSNLSEESNDLVQTMRSLNLGSNQPTIPLFHVLFYERLDVVDLNGLGIDFHSSSIPCELSEYSIERIILGFSFSNDHLQVVHNHVENILTSRSLLIDYLAQVLGGDRLAADYMIIYLMSRL